MLWISGRHVFTSIPLPRSTSCRTLVRQEPTHSSAIARHPRAASRVLRFRSAANCEADSYHLTTGRCDCRTIPTGVAIVDGNSGERAGSESYQPGTHAETESQQARLLPDITTPGGYDSNSAQPMGVKCNLECAQYIPAAGNYSCTK